ncbi:MAG: hypothetical protein HPY50_04775 [Firmicutes bacterium]|nr:hypothetical protein [Bacillota bacterium]
MVAYIVGIIALVIVTAFVVLTSVFLGLKWKFQVEVERVAPTVELPPLPNPLAAFQERRRENSQADNILDEYLNGPQEGGADRK